MAKRNYLKQDLGLLTIGIILLVIIIAIVLINLPKGETPEEVAKCIGRNSKLYTQLGCHACETQEEMFGDNYQYLTVVDCFFDSAVSSVILLMMSDFLRDIRRRSSFSESLRVTERLHHR